MKSRTALLIPFLLFFFSLLLRISLVSKGAYNVDCLGITIQAEMLLHEGRLNYFTGFGFPLTIIFASFFVLLGNLFSVADSVSAVNYMGVVFGSLCIPVFYYLIEKLMDRPCAIIGSVLLSLCPVFLGYSLLGMTHAPALFFQLLAMLYAILYLENFKKNKLFLSALFFGLLGAARFQDMVMILPVMGYIYLFMGKPAMEKRALKEKLIDLAQFIFFSGLACFIFYVPYLLGQLRSNYLEQLGSYGSISLVYFDKIFFISAFVYNIKLMIMTLSPAGFIMCLVSLALFYRFERRLFWLMVIWVGVPVFLFSNLFTIAPRHQILMIPALIAMECYTLRRFLLFNIRFRLSAIIIFFLIIYLTFIHYLPVFVYRHHHSIITEYAKWLGQVTEPNAHIIATDITHFIQRYAQRTSGGRILRARHLYNENELKVYQKDLEALIEQGTPVYITETGLYTYDTDKKFSSFMEENFDLELIDRRPYEDWHRGYLFVDVAQNALFKIGIKK